VPTWQPSRDAGWADHEPPAGAPPRSRLSGRVRVRPHILRDVAVSRPPTRQRGTVDHHIRPVQASPRRARPTANRRVFAPSTANARSRTWVSGNSRHLSRWQLSHPRVVAGRSPGRSVRLRTGVALKPVSCLCVVPFPLPSGLRGRIACRVWRRPRQLSVAATPTPCGSPPCCVAPLTPAPTTLAAGSASSVAAVIPYSRTGPRSFPVPECAFI